MPKCFVTRKASHLLGPCDSTVIRTHTSLPVRHELFMQGCLRLVQGTIFHPCSTQVHCFGRRSHPAGAEKQLRARLDSGPLMYGVQRLEVLLLQTCQCIIGCTDVNYDGFARICFSAHAGHEKSVKRCCLCRCARMTLRSIMVTLSTGGAYGPGAFFGSIVGITFLILPHDQS